MAARTRTAIKALVRLNTGRTKDTLESYLCDTALKVALLQHPFKDAQSEPSDFALTEDETEVDISGTTDLVNIVTARIVEADGSRNEKLTLKTRTWWDKHVVNPEDNNKGWPVYGLRWGDYIRFDRPLESGLELRLRVTTVQTFASDSTVCPIALLDVFVEHYVTAHVFKSLKHWDAYKQWMQSACGIKWSINGEPGGELLKAIQADTVGDTALELKVERYEDADARGRGVSVENLITGHDDYGNTRTWW